MLRGCSGFQASTENGGLITRIFKIYFIHDPLQIHVNKTFLLQNVKNDGDRQSIPLESSHVEILVFLTLAWADKRMT